MLPATKLMNQGDKVFIVQVVDPLGIVLEIEGCYADEDFAQEIAAQGKYYQIEEVGFYFKENDE